MKPLRIVYLILVTIVILFAVNYMIDFKLKNFKANLDFVTKTEIQQTQNSQRSKSISVDSIQQSLINSAQTASKYVVSVNVLKRKQSRKKSYTIFDQLFGLYPSYKDVKSIGTGVIITKDGYVVTNAHVVESAIDITVVLDNGEYKKATLIGTAMEHDIAVLKLEGDDYACATIGDSHDLALGQFVYALGNPYGFVIKDSKPTLSFGVISAVNRNFSNKSTTEDTVYKRMLQTDAAINPGNSGGPLVSLNGEVVGINTFILSDSGGSVGIGFAIPINRVKKVVYELVQYGKIRNIDFGFRVRNYNNKSANEFSIKIAKIDENTNCAKSGMKVNDVLTGINGVSISEKSDINLAIIDIFVGNEAVMTVMRDGQEIIIKYIVEERKY